LPEIQGLIFVQLALLLATAQLVAYGIRRLGQPPVIGQMISGLVLGPSVLGLIAPQLQQLLFPPSSMGVLRAMGQVGLVLYMFVVGTEMDRAFLRRHIRGAAAVSSAGVTLPLFAGALLAIPLIGDATLFRPGVAGWSQVIFFASAMAVTAFPVMARIIHERGLVGTSVANVALAAGSVSDVVAWGLLAVVLAGVASHLGGVILILGGGALVAIAILTAVRILLRRYMPAAADDTLSFIVVLTLLMLCAWGTTATGLHPAFGAFLLGVAMPRHRVTTMITQRISPLAVSLLLPIFFIYTGLNTTISLVNTPRLVLLALVVIVVACLSKGVGCWLAASAAGYRQRDALAIGALMNARGLVELIILTAALESGIITPTLFSIMVLMTIVTTLMAAPLLRMLYRPAPAAYPTVPGSDVVSPREVTPEAVVEGNLGLTRPGG
jgi:Kef-type K+ transport system membrane component KefB